MARALSFLQWCSDYGYDNNFFHLIPIPGITGSCALFFCHYHCSISDMKRLGCEIDLDMVLPCFSPPCKDKSVLLFNCLYKGWFKQRSFLHQLRGRVAAAERHIAVPVTCQLQMGMALPVDCGTLGVIIWIQCSSHSNSAVRIWEPSIVT